MPISEDRNYATPYLPPFCRSGILPRQRLRLSVPVTAGSRSYKETAVYLRLSAVFPLPVESSKDLAPQSFPKLRMAPQSGHVQTMPLHVMPQKFSSMQSEQIMNPQGQLQQKG
jgi:hypothetical protein